MNEIIRSSPSDRDVAAILNYFLEQCAEEAADHFLTGLEKTFNAIAALPNLGHPWESSDPRDKDLRLLACERFPELISCSIG